MFLVITHPCLDPAGLWIVMYFWTKKMPLLVNCWQGLALLEPMWQGNSNVMLTLLVLCKVTTPVMYFQLVSSVEASMVVLANTSQTICNQILHRMCPLICQHLMTMGIYSWVDFLKRLVYSAAVRQVWKVLFSSLQLMIMMNFWMCMMQIRLMTLQILQIIHLHKRWHNSCKSHRCKTNLRRSKTCAISMSYSSVKRSCSGSSRSLKGLSMNYSCRCNCNCRPSSQKMSVYCVKMNAVSMNCLCSGRCRKMKFHILLLCPCPLMSH